MIRKLAGLLGGVAERCLRESLLGIITMAVAALFAAASLGFGTFAAYVWLNESEGPVVAALILCAAYGLVAIVICAARVVRRRAARLRRAAAVPASPGDVDSLLQTIAATSNQPDQSALIAAMRLGRALSPMQMLVLALIGGFVAGRKLGK